MSAQEHVEDLSQDDSKSDYCKRLFYDDANTAFYREEGDLYQHDLESGTVQEFKAENPGKILEDAANQSKPLSELRKKLI